MFPKFHKVPLCIEDQMKGKEMEGMHIFRGHQVSEENLRVAAAVLELRSLETPPPLVELLTQLG